MLNPDKPLWLPQGTVRAMLAISVVTAWIVSIFRGDESDALAAAATGILGIYFGLRHQATNGVNHDTP